MTFIPTSRLAQAKGRAGRNQAFSASSGMKVGKVIAVNRLQYTVDLVLQSGETLREVKVSSSALSTRTGHSYLAKVSNTGRSSQPQRAQGSFIDDRTRTIYALVEYVKDDLDSPIVIGFVLPRTNQMNFDREGFDINRHETDQYSMTEVDQESTYDPTTDTKLSNFEWVHPSGFWIRVGRGAIHEDLTGKDVQGLARFRGTANANTAMRTPGPDTVDYLPVTVKHPSGTGVTLDDNFNIHTSPTGKAEVNDCEILTECSTLATPIFDLLGHALVDFNGDPVLTNTQP